MQPYNNTSESGLGPMGMSTNEANSVATQHNKTKRTILGSLVYAIALNIAVRLAYMWEFLGGITLTRVRWPVQHAK